MSSSACDTRTDIAATAPRRAVALSVVAPCYNEAESLQELYRRVSAVCRDTMGADYEIVLVNDGSADTTWADIRDLTGQDPHVVGVNMWGNQWHRVVVWRGVTGWRGVRV